MNLSEQENPKYNPSEQLKLLTLQCKKFSPKLYRLHALYLDYVRLILPKVVRQSVFFLLTEEKEYQFNSPNSELKQSTLDNIDSLISKSVSTLTIEHLMNLSDEMRKEENNKLKQKQESLLNELNLNEDRVILDSLSQDSISLQSNPPIDNNKILDSSFLSKEANFEVDITLYSHSEDIKSKSDLAINNLKEESTSRNKSKLLNLEQNHGLEVIKKIFERAGKSFGKEVIEDKKPSIAGDKEESSKDVSFLPDNPVELFYWQNSLDIALARVLRNLSNSINLELLTSGLLTHLVPVSLLDAVIDGQIVSQDSPSNLLKLSIPISSSIQEDMLEVSCILLRYSDLEFDFPKLRQYRSLLKKNRNILGRMIKQQRHWQNRLFANDVGRQWMQSPQETTKTNNMRD